MDSRGTVRALFALLVAVVLGGASVVFLFQLITTYQAKIEEAQKPEDTVMVMVAARDLYPGVTINQEDLVALEIPPRFLPSGVYLTPDHVVGQRPRERILTNEFVRAERLANPETGEGLNAIIPRQMRAISVEIANGAALSGFLDPGNYVDVIVTTTTAEKGGGGKGTTETHTILQSMFVLAVNNRTQQGNVDVGKGAGRSTVTLMVTGEQAKSIAYAEQVGELHLSLRNDLDTNTFVESTGVDISGVVGLIEKRKEVRTRKKTASKPKPAAPKPPPAPVEPETTVRIIQGSQVTDEKVEDE